MHLDRGAGPVGAGLRCRTVTDGDDDVHCGRLRACEFIPAFASDALCVYVRGSQYLKSERIDLSLGCAAGAEALDRPAEFARQMVEHGFAQNAAGRIVGAKNKNVDGHVGFCALFQQQLPLIGMEIFLPGAFTTTSLVDGVGAQQALGVVVCFSEKTGMLLSV